LYDHLKELEKVVKRIKNHLFAILDMEFADGLCVREKWLGVVKRLGVAGQRR
jgi:hypothetical protein